MNIYRVLVHGKNFLMTIDKKATKLGFYTTRFVEAANELEAETVTMSILRQDEYLRGAVLNTTDDPPMMYVEETEKVSILKKAQGFTFYSGEEEE